MVVVGPFAHEDLSAFEVGLLEADETKDELEYAIEVIIEENNAVLGKLVIVTQLHHVCLAQPLAQALGQNSVVLLQINYEPPELLLILFSILTLADLLDQVFIDEEDNAHLWKETALGGM